MNTLEGMAAGTSDIESAAIVKVRSSDLGAAGEGERIVGLGRRRIRTREVASYPPNLRARFGGHYVWPHPSSGGIDSSGAISAVSHPGIASLVRRRLSTGHGPAGRQQ
jgi:hypothetical protein